MEGKAIHDKMLETLPDGVVHQMAACRFCLADALDEGDHGGAPVTTYSQEELDRAVAAAVADANAEATKLKAAQATAELDAKVAEVTAAKDAELADLAKKVEAAELLAQTEKAAREAMETFLADEAAREAEEKELAARLETRLAEVAELQVPWTPEQIAAKAPAWAALTDEEWDSRKAEWAEIAGRTVTTVPAHRGGSGLSGARETADLHTRQGGAATSAAAVMGSLRELSSAGVDPRQLTGA
jgi:hypothetical protein